MVFQRIYIYIWYVRPHIYIYIYILFEGVWFLTTVISARMREGVGLLSAGNASSTAGTHVAKMLCFT